MTFEELKEAKAKNKAYIREHRENVLKAFNILVGLGIVERGTELCSSLYGKIATHDFSKEDEEEFEPYALRFFTPNGKEEYKKEFDYAWLHHIHKNPHHWNYWVLVDGEGKITALEMPEVYVYEMVCDWLSFGIKKGDLSEIKSFNESKRKEYILHPNTRKLVDSIIDKIVEGVHNKRNRMVLQFFGIDQKEGD